MGETPPRFGKPIVLALGFTMAITIGATVLWATQTVTTCKSEITQLTARLDRLTSELAELKKKQAPDVTVTQR